MSTVLKKEDAERMAFSYKPKALRVETAVVAKDFISHAAVTDTGFVIADVVAKQSGVSALRKQQLEAQVEETVLAKLKEIEEQAYKQAYDLGLIEGAERAYKEQSEDLQASRGHFDETMSTLNSLILKLCKQYEFHIMEMIFKIAERIAMREIKSDEKLIVDVLNKVAGELQAAQKIKVFINPDDLKFVEELRAKDPKQVEALERVKLEPKADITQGGCFVETEFGSIDATVEQRVEKAWMAIESKLPIVQTGDPAGKS